MVKRSFYEIYAVDHIGLPKEMIMKFTELDWTEDFKKTVLDNLEHNGYTQVEVIRVDKE